MTNKEIDDFLAELQSSEWYVWRNCATGAWSTDWGDLQVIEYLDDRGRYCLHMVDYHVSLDVDDKDPWTNDVVVLDVETDETGASSSFRIENR